jgi:hypothetical protein
MRCAVVSPILAFELSLITLNYIINIDIKVKVNVKVKVKFNLKQATKAHRDLGDRRCVCEHHAPATLPLGKTWYPLYRRLGPRAGLDGCRKSPHTWIRSLNRPARSQSVYRLCYPDSLLTSIYSFHCGVNYYLLYILYYNGL